MRGFACVGWARVGAWMIATATGGTTSLGLMREVDGSTRPLIPCTALSIVHCALCPPSVPPVALYGVPVYSLRTTFLFTSVHTASHCHMRVRIARTLSTDHWTIASLLDIRSS